MRDLWHYLLQAGLWLAAVCFAVICIAWLVNALDEHKADTDAISPELLRDMRSKNRLIALRRSAETHKEPPHAA